MAEGENFFNIVDERPFFKVYKRMAEMEHRKKKNDGSAFFDYIIIRNDGTIEYGPQSGDP